MLQAAKYFIAAPQHFAYYLHLDDPKVVRAMRYRFKNKSIIYGFRCHITRMMYIGSTLTPGLRFSEHLITGHHSNEALQEAMQVHGLSNFTGYVFKIVDVPKHLTTNQARAYLSKIEQTYLDKFPEEQLYNVIKSSKD